MPNPGKSVYVIQHTDGEFLGLIEDHLEGRGIAFTYIRPHSNSGRLPATLDYTDGVFLLGGGPWGSAGKRNLPTLDDEILLAKECLERSIPIVGIGLGSQILALAAGGSSAPEDPFFDVCEARRCHEKALNGFLPERMPMAVYMRDRPLPPNDADVLAVDNSGRPAIFQIGPCAVGFTAHPGVKSAMIEDLIMEFDESPPNSAAGLQALRACQRGIEDAMVGIMTGLIQVMGLMAKDQ
jgi:GMP synthase-like glutamine amidotransferase